MSTVKPIYIIALIFVILFTIYLKASNPYKKYSTMKFWKSATLTSVSEIPDEALQPGNKNGPVIMWASIGANDPAILKALSKRGADVNESDGIFKGTPLTGAAGYTQSPEMIAELIRLGADINKTVNNNETALMIAAQYNEIPGIINVLVKHGAKPQSKNSDGKTALDLARHNKNDTAIEELESL